MDHKKRLRSRRDLLKGERFLAQVDPKMSQCIERFGRCGLAPWKQRPFDLLIRSIVSQQLSTKAAKSILSRCYTGIGDTHFTAENLAVLSKEKLRACGLSNAKTEYAFGIAFAVQQQRLHLDQLKELDEQQVVENLTQIKGVGVWTAQMFMMFGLGFPDVWSFGDLGLKKAVAFLSETDELPDLKRFNEVGEIWRPYRSIASWYLWRLLEAN